MGLEVYFKVLGATLLLLGTFLFLTHLFKKVKGPAFSREGTIRIKEIKSLGFKAQLILVEVKDRTLLLGLSEKGLNLLREWEDVKEA